MRGRSPLEVDTFSFHLDSKCALQSPTMSPGNKGELQNGDPSETAIRRWLLRDVDDFAVLELVCDSDAAAFRSGL